MQTQPRLPLVLLGLAFVSLVSGAAARRPTVDQIVEATSADRVLTHAAPPRHAAGKSSAPTDAEVGDSDSFGRNVRWLGLAAGQVNLTTGTCDPASPDPCQVLAPPGRFAFSDIARIQLPAGATHSLLCYWFSPLLAITYDNPTAATQLALVQYTPTVTVENPVLDDPALVDPTTGAPFGGHLLTSMTSSQRINTPLPAGVNYTDVTRLSSVCIAGLLSRKQLAESFGLSPSQVDAFFHNPTTLRLNVSGTLRYVSDAQLYFGLRVVGD
ncbi:MAG TPA: hypothetical protein VLM17_08730 [Xanthomonadaceae bacterium]|nr:hypothetical protein [Xanthomonadaceae bacterium]